MDRPTSDYPHLGYIRPYARNDYKPKAKILEESSQAKKALKPAITPLPVEEEQVNTAWTTSDKEL